MSNKIKLLPCPFCGGEAGILKNGVGCYQVYCDNCETRQYAYAHKTKELAIEAWNTRKPIDRIIERLQEKITDAVNAADREVSFDYRQMDYSEAEAFTEVIEMFKDGGLSNE